MFKNRRTRFISLFICALLALLPANAAQVDLPPVSVTASWVDSQGAPQQAVAQQLSFPGYENAYWLYLTQEAVQADAELSFTDNYGYYPGGFTQPDGTPLSMLGFTEAGMDLSQEPVYFQGLDADGMPVADFMLYISTQAEIPAPPVAPAVVTVRFVDSATGSDIADSYTIEVMPGDQQIIPALQIEGYTPDNSEITVTADANGVPNMQEAVFYYTKNAAPAVVTVRFVDSATGSDIADSYTIEVMPGDQQIIPALQIEGYTPDNSEITVTADANGVPNMQEAVFYYTKNAAPAVVTVRFVDSATGSDIADSYTIEVMPGDQQIIPALQIEGYTPDNSEITVTADANGVPSMQEAVFYYTKNAAPAVVTVRFVDSATGSDIADSYTIEVMPGDQQIIPAQQIEGYTPNNSEITVTADANGVPSMQEAVFYYTKNATPAVVTVRFVDGSTGSDIADSYTIEVMPGDQQIIPALQIEGYTPDNSEITVTADANGVPSMPEVVFYYNLIVTEAPTTAPNAVVKVYYLDKADSKELLNMQTVEIAPGTEQTIAAPPIEGYTPDNSEITVTADANGVPSMPEVVFYYNLIVTEAPTETPTEAPEEASVTVRYVDKDTNAEIAAAQIVKVPVNQESDVYAQPDGLEAGYALSDGVDVQKVYADESGAATPDEIIFYYSRMPLPKIKVYFLEEGTNKAVAAEQEITLDIGEQIIEARPENLLDGYEITGESSYIVNASYGGADVDSVTFYYKQKLSEPVDVMVHYLDEQGNPVASSQKVSCADGTNSIKAQPEDLKEGYVLSDKTPETQYVIVEGGAASPDQIIFEYIKPQEETQAPTSTPKPAPKVALVKVYYRDQFGANLIDPPDTVSCVEGEENIIRVDESRVNGSLYKLTSEGTQKVTVDSEGNATPAEVVFLFKDLSVDRKAQITVRYVDKDGDSIAPDQMIQIGVGSTIIKNSLSAPEGYKALEPLEQTVTLSREGEVSSDTVVFTYEKLPATPTPSPSAFPYDITPLDRYAYPRSDSVNFRSSPQVSNDNVISVVSAKDLAHITGSLVNSRDEMWYEAEINGQKGFIRENVTKLLSDEEAANALGYTPAPTASPTPAPSAIVDGMPINRWATANVGSLNTRKKATKSSDVVARLNKGDEMFVFQQQTVDGKPWYVIKVNNKDAFVLSEYVTLMSETESERKQASLNSPVPFITLPPVEATDTPAPTFTAIPVTATPVPATAPPAAYLGYALTTKKANLSTGVGNAGELSIAMLPENTIVLISGQTYVDGVAWDIVEALPIRQKGYVKDSVLKRISAAEAQPYLDALQAAPLETPTAAPPLQQFSGFGITNGENVPLRTNMDTNARILEMLPRNEIVQVYGQEYGGGDIWHTSRHKENYGFIRQDQLRLLTPEEEANYLASLKVTLPPVATPQIPPSSSSLSSYGYVTADKVRLRGDASTDAAYIKMMDKNQFALVLGTRTDNNGKMWYHINQAGTEGYVMSDYFTVLPMNQLTSFLQSEEYLEANTNTNAGNTTSNNITPVEDFNTQVWTNPHLAQTSYEPFNPLGTPTPNVEEIVTPTPSPSASPTPTVSLNPLETRIPEEAPSSSFPTGLLVLAIVAVLGAGGYYGYYMYTKNRKNAAQRAAKRKMMSQDAKRGNNGYAPPNARTPRNPNQGTTRFNSNANGQNGRQPTAQFRPNANNQNAGQPTTQFRPNANNQNAGQSTTQFRPNANGQNAGQPTTQFRPNANNQNAGQPTAQFRPNANGPNAGQPTAQFRPNANNPNAGQSTTQFRPNANNQNAEQTTAQFRPNAGQRTNKPAAKPENTDKTSTENAADSPKTHVRHRRSDKHDKA